MQGMEVERLSYSGFSQMNVTYRSILKTILNVYKEHTNKCKYIHWTSFLICFSIWHRRRYGFNIVYILELPRWYVMCCVPDPLRAASICSIWISIFHICKRERWGNSEIYSIFPNLCSTNNNIKLFIRESNHSLVKRDVVQQQICSFYRTLHRAALSALLLICWWCSVELSFWIALEKTNFKNCTTLNPAPSSLVSDDFQRCLFMLWALFFCYSLKFLTSFFFFM